MRTRTLSCAVGVLLAASALSACGSSASGNGVASKSADQIVAAAKAATKGLKSVHVAGSITSSGTKVSLNLYMASGEATGSVSEGPLSFQIIVAGGNDYMKAAASVWQHYSPAAATLLAGKWLEVPAGNSSFASLTELANANDLFSQLLASHGTLVKGSTSAIDGVPAIAITDTTKGGTLYVATTGKPYPLEISASGGPVSAGKSGEISFNDFNAPFTATAPANAVNLAQLEKTG
jgi:hypothetical protein